MIIKTSTGTKVTGTLTRDPEMKETKSGNSFLSLSVKAHSVKDESGKWNSVFVECCLWKNLDQWDGLLQKGDFVEVCGKELKSREANGKTYWSLLDVDGVVVGGLVNARWVQMAIDLMQPVAPAGEPAAAATDGFAEEEGPTPFDAEPAPAASRPVPVAQQYADDADRIINDDADDLPF